MVRFATQRSLGREVAVKTLRPTACSEAATRCACWLRLLRDVWVTGTLEHPNIVPRWQPIEHRPRFTREGRRPD